MSITLQIAQQRLTQYLDAEAAVLQRQEYKIADRSVKFADLAEIRAGITYWQGKVDEETATSTGRPRYRVPTPRW